MNTLSSLCKCCLASIRDGNRRLAAQSKALLSKRLIPVLSVVVFCAALQPFAVAQQEPQRPFIEPTEMRHKVLRKAATPQPAQTGRWDTLNQLMPINPVHVALMHNHKILVVSGSGNDPDNHNLQAGVWNIPTRTINTFPLAWDMFCNGTVILPDGRPFVLGGTLQYDPFLGQLLTATFNPVTGSFTDMAQMSGGRWYPTGTVLGNGSVLVVSGLNNTNSNVNATVQKFTGTAWTAAGTIFPGVPLYPRQHLLPNGKVFEDGANRNSKMYDQATQLWTDVATTIFTGSRDYGTSVLLPLNPANGYQPKVMILGGADGSSPATDTTELIDLSVNQPQWVNGPRMDRSRVQLNATILPNGKVLVSGGSTQSEIATPTDSLSTQLYDPDSNSFSPAGSLEFPRLYHSNTILLPDATVMAVGGNPERGVYEPHVEIYSPPYLFNADGSPAVQPVITGVTPSVIRYGTPFRITAPATNSIRQVVLVRPGAVTHAFDMEQRLVRLNFTASYGSLSVTAPPNGNIAPPGYYMLFIVNSAGVPSEARFVRLVQGNIYGPRPSRL
jgi:Domain of unknown function (DUF1929)/Glyoxal oxidase N-terminus